MFSIHYDPDANIVHVSKEGFWDVPTAIAYGKEVIAKCTVAQHRHGDFAALLDVRRFAVQAGDVNDLNVDLLHKVLMMTKGPIAVVTAKMLNKMQIDRLLSGTPARCFLDYDAAREWIVAELAAKRVAA